MVVVFDFEKKKVFIDSVEDLNTLHEAKKRER